MYIINGIINSDDIPYESRRAASLSTHSGVSYVADTFLVVEA